MNRKTLLACIAVGAVAYCLGSSRPATKDRPILRWVQRAVGLWLVFRDDPPAQQENQARYVHLEPGAVDHGNAL